MSASHPQGSVEVVAPQATRSAEPPLVSVLLPCYNHARFVQETLEGVAAQTFRDFELIIVDDGSTDASRVTIASWMREHLEMRTRLVVHDRNQGVCAAFNSALWQAHGKYVAELSADDVWLPHFLEAFVREMEQQPQDVALLYGDAQTMTEEGEMLPGRFTALHRRFEVLPAGDIFLELARGNWIPATATLIRRSCLDAVGGYDEAMCHEDYDLWLRLAHRYRAAVTPVIGTRVRLVRRSLSRGNGRAAVEHYTRMFFKVLGWRPEADPIIRKQLVDHIEVLYKINHPRRHEHMHRYLQASPSWYMRYLYICSRCGLSFRAADRLRRLVVGVVHAARWAMGRSAKQKALAT